MQTMCQHLTSSKTSDEQMSHEKRMAHYAIQNQRTKKKQKSKILRDPSTKHNVSGNRTKHRQKHSFETYKRQCEKNKKLQKNQHKHEVCELHLPKLIKSAGKQQHPTMNSSSSKQASPLICGKFLNILISVLQPCECLCAYVCEFVLLTEYDEFSHDCGIKVRYEI